MISSIELITMFFVATSFLKALKETQQKSVALAYNKGNKYNNIKTRRE